MTTVSPPLQFTPAEIEVLFPEAHRRERRRRTAVAGLVTTLLIGVAAGLYFSSQPPPPNGPGAPPTGSDDSRGPVAVLGGYTFGGDGLGPARFGQSESVAIRELNGVLGRPVTSVPRRGWDCSVDASMLWPTMTAYFFHGRFVGYNSANVMTERNATGVPKTISRASTAGGLRIGDVVSRGERLYGGAFSVSSAQGGSWQVTTRSGDLRGYLTAVPNHPTPPIPRVADISAGSVGCPAETP